MSYNFIYYTSIKLKKVNEFSTFKETFTLKISSLTSFEKSDYLALSS